MVRRIIGAAVALVLVTALVDLGSTAGAATVSPTEWAPKFCSALSEWEKSLQQGADVISNASTDVTDLKAARAQLVQFLDQSVAVTNAAVKKIERAGVPRSPNGAKIAGTLVGGLKSAGALFAGAEKKAAALPTDDRDKFGTRAVAIGKSITKGGQALGKSLGKVTKLDTGGLLSRALTNEPSCSALQSGG
jgi:hypothetical protein